ncbi:Sulfate transporter, CysZ-type [hydrothermal vent metagenome]|uniref:Sulfate transporter, CysZ-type n=1 Tax=hydrothermal vent metagenome TaxID=652676 RepID=A0A3B0Z5D9_9ZZZZ
MKDILNGPRYLLEGVALLTQPKLRRFVVIPLIINILLFSVLIFWAYSWVNGTTQWLLSQLPSWLQWLSFFVLPLFWSVSLVVIFYSFSVVANLIGAPFNGLLAEAVEAHLTGKTFESDWRDVMRDIPPAVFSELRKLLYYLLRAVPLFIMLWIPLINLPATVIWVLFGAWMMAVQYLDFPMANHRVFFAEQRTRLRRRPLLAWSFGGLVMLCTLIPVVNFIVMPAAVAGATVMWVRESELIDKRTA